MVPLLVVLLTHKPTPSSLTINVTSTHSVCLSVCLSVRPSVRLSVCLSVCLAHERDVTYCSQLQDNMLTGTIPEAFKAMYTPTRLYVRARMHAPAG